MRCRRKRRSRIRQLREQLVQALAIDAARRSSALESEQWSPRMQIGVLRWPPPARCPRACAIALSAAMDTSAGWEKRGRCTCSSAHALLAAFSSASSVATLALAMAERQRLAQRWSERSEALLSFFLRKCSYALQCLSHDRRLSWNHIGSLELHASVRRKTWCHARMMKILSLLIDA